MKEFSKSCSAIYLPVLFCLLTTFYFSNARAGDQHLCFNQSLSNNPGKIFIVSDTEAPVFLDPLPESFIGISFLCDSISFTISASDPQSDPVTLTATGLPPTAVMTPSFPVVGNPVISVFKWLPSTSPIGAYNIVFTATDTNGNQTTYTVFIDYALSVLSGPVFNIPNCGFAYSISDTATLVIPINVADKPFSDIVTITAIGIPEGATITPPLPLTGNPLHSEFRWSPTSSQVGNHNIVFTATDRCGLVNTCSFSVDVSSTGVTGLIRYGDNLQPVSNGRVFALKLNSITNEVIILDSADIQSNGVYFIPNLPPDPIYIVAYPNSDLDFVPTYYPSTIDWQNAITIIPGSLSDIDVNVFRIENGPEPNSMGGGVYLSSRFDLALDHAIIYARLDGQFKNYSVSAPNGDYNIDNLPNGVYDIYANRLGFESDSFQIKINNASVDSINIYLSPMQQKFLKLTSFIEGFYDQQSNSMISDSIIVNLRNYESPYSLVESSKSISGSNRITTFNFYNAMNNTQYYFQIMHRNSIETWSNGVFAFTSDSIDFDLSSAQSQAFGNNMKLVDNAPVRYGIYSGDENQDGIIDATDIIDIYNDAKILLSGYVRTDITGDDFVDVSDVLIAFNNSKNVVSVIRP